MAASSNAAIEGRRVRLARRDLGEKRNTAVCGAAVFAAVGIIEGHVQHSVAAMSLTEPVNDTVLPSPRVIRRNPVPEDSDSGI